MCVCSVCPGICCGYLGCFHLLAVVNNAGMDMSVQISFESLLSIFGVYTQKWNCWVV
jgi:hypothetical protein